MKTARPYRVTATGTAFDSGGNAQLTMIAANLQAGAAAAATAIVRETDGSGAILAELGAPQGESKTFTVPVSFAGKIHVTLSGSGASAIVYV